MDKNGGIYANIRGLFPSSNQTKIPYLQDLATMSNAPFILLTETHLNPEILDAEIHIKNYTLFRSDRVGRSHGGVCTYVRNDLAAEMLLKDSNSYCDSLIIKVHQMNLTLINVYRPPGCKSELFIQTMETLRVFLRNCEEYESSSSNILIFGDFNFPGIIWKHGSGYLKSENKNCAAGEERKQALCLLNFAEEFFLEQLIQIPTRNRNILDLMFANNHLLINNYSVVCNSRLSDHYIVKFDVNYEQKVKTTEKSKDFYKTRLNEYDFFNASDELWLRFNLLIMNINFEEIFRNLSTSQMLEKFYEVIEDTVDIIFEKKEALKEKEKDIFKSSNRIPRNVRILMRNKSKLSKSILSSKSGKKITALRFKLQKIESDLEDHYRKRKENQENEAICKIRKNPKFFYSYAKRFSKVKSNIGPFIDKDGEVVNDSFKMSEMLRAQYEKSFSVPVENATIADPEAFFAEDHDEEMEPSLPYIHFTFKDVIEAIDDLSTNASPGPDYFPAILLKKGKQTLCHPLSQIFRSSLESGEVPDILKCAYITPLFKSGPKSLPINYRPVSLTSHLTKTFERIIRKSLVAFLEVNQKMNPSQHGFRNRRSCLSQLLEHYDQILKILENGDNLDCVYLDFAKCFDKIDIGLLCHKLKKTGIRSQLGVWLHSFLINRKQFIVVENSLSNSSNVISGIPQGTVLGPILALVFLSDIDKDVENIASMFADDTRLMGKVQNETDVEALQSDLNKVFEWANKNNMEKTTWNSIAKSLN